MMGGFGFGGMGIFGLLTQLLLIGGVIYVIIQFTNNRGKDNKYERTSSLDILERRFANGEIDEEEYNRKKDILLKK